MCMSQRVRPHGGERPLPTRCGRAPHGSAYRAQTTAASHGPGSSRRGAEDMGRRGHPNTVSERVLSSGGRHSRAEEECDPFEDVLRDPAALNPTCPSFLPALQGSAVARTRGSTSVLQRIRDVSQPLSYNKSQFLDARGSLPFLSSLKPKLGDSLKISWRRFPPRRGTQLNTSTGEPGALLPRERDARATHSALFPPHSLQTGSQITSGAGNWEQTAALGHSHHGSPHNTNGLKLAGAGPTSLSNPEYSHSLPTSREQEIKV